MTFVYHLAKDYSISPCLSFLWADQPENLDNSFYRERSHSPNQSLSCEWNRTEYIYLFSLLPGFFCIISTWSSLLWFSSPKIANGKNKRRKPPTRGSRAMLCRIPHLLKVRCKLQTCPIIAHRPALCLIQVLLLRRRDATWKSFTFEGKKVQ